MEGSLQNKLLQHEVTPPATVWEKISRQLDEEFVPSDSSISVKLEQAAIAPPAIAWENIEAALHPSKTKVVPIGYKRIAVAAAVLGLIAISAVYFFNNNGGNAVTTTANSVAVNNSNNSAPVSPPTAKQEKTIQPSRTLAAASPVRPQSFARTASSRRRIAESPEQAYLTYAELEMDPEPIQAMASLEQPVEVEAPPIRDARGNIIMDYSVISKPNDPYITITSPNGNQTRISNKFLHCLSYLNGDFSSGDINYEGREWKNRFEEWRNKLLSEGAFVPAASNFFDIFELKALIEE